MIVYLKISPGIVCSNQTRPAPSINTNTTVLNSLNIQDIVTIGALNHTQIKNLHIIYVIEEHSCLVPRETLRKLLQNYNITQAAT